VAFGAVSVEAAEAIHREHAASLAALARQITPVRHQPAIDETRLMQTNLVSGMVDAHNWSHELP
jgi:hypothetical protein